MLQNGMLDERIAGQIYSDAIHDACDTPVSHNTNPTTIGAIVGTEKKIYIQIELLLTQIKRLRVSSAYKKKKTHSWNGPATEIHYEDPKTKERSKPMFTMVVITEEDGSKEDEPTDYELSMMDTILDPRTPVEVGTSLFLKLLPHVKKLNGTEEWISYGRTLAGAGVEYSPLDLIQVSAVYKKASLFPKISITTGKSYEVPTLLAKLVSVFRITSAGDASGSYKDQLATKLEKLFQQSPYNATNIKHVAGATTWKEDNHLQALLGCLDQFLIHNPTHEFNALRAGSLIMHGKDCAVIPIVDYISKLLNFHPDELSTLGVYRRLGEEILNLLEHLEDEEYSKPDSLFYYARAYVLMEKSPAQPPM